MYESIEFIHIKYLLMDHKSIIYIILNISHIKYEV